jgi:hypothetical protein
MLPDYCVAKSTLPKHWNAALMAAFSEQGGSMEDEYW